MDEINPVPGNVYVLGVDWNKSAGTHMVIVEWTGKANLLKKIVVPESEYIQTDSVQMIIDLNQQWNFKHIFVDAGYGSTQVEMLKKYGVSNLGSGLQHKVKEVHMNQSIEILDPITNKSVKKPAKQFLVQQTVKLLEDKLMVLPESEDTSVTGDKQMGLVQQMRNFYIESYSVHGLPRYSQGQEHTLTAIYLSLVVAWCWKTVTLSKVHSRSVELLSLTPLVCLTLRWKIRLRNIKRL